MAGDCKTVGHWEDVSSCLCGLAYLPKIIKLLKEKALNLGLTVNGGVLG